MGAEDHWLDALQAQSEGDSEQALLEARACVDLDPDHADAWMLIATTLCPPMPRARLTLEAASAGLRAVREVVRLEPERTEAWVLGGRLLANELGMTEEALRWWEAIRPLAPRETTPLIEQATLYRALACTRRQWAASKRSSMLISRSGMHRWHACLVQQTLTRAAEQEATTHFQARQRRHTGWTIIEQRKDSKPVSHQPLFPDGHGANTHLGVPRPKPGIARCLRRGRLGWVLLHEHGLPRDGHRRHTVSMNMQQRMNLALNLLRALEIETTSGCVVVPETIRAGKLHAAVVANQSPAWRTRHERILELGTSLPSSWRPDLPDFGTYEERMSLTFRRRNRRDRRLGPRSGHRAPRPRPRA